MKLKKCVFHERRSVFQLLVFSTILLIIIYSLSKNISVDESVNHINISSMRILLLNDIDRLPASQMSNGTFSGENLRNISFVYQQLNSKSRGNLRNYPLVGQQLNSKSRGNLRNILLVGQQLNSKSRGNLRNYPLVGQQLNSKLRGNLRNHPFVSQQSNSKLSGRYFKHPVSRYNLCKNILPLRNLIDRLRIYRDLKLKSMLNKDSLHSLLNEFEKNVFPWLRPIDSLLNGYEKGTKGIVMCLNDKYLGIGISSIMALQVIGNKLPIEIFYHEEKELSIENRNRLKSLPFVRSIFDLSNIFNNTKNYLPIGDKIAGTYVKPFAILGSSFEHVLLMDADVYFFVNPSILFHHQEYLNKNFLLFSDRTMDGSKSRTEYLKSIMPQPYSVQFNQSRIIRGTSAYETESGVVLVNKSNKLSYLALLTICLLNTRCYRREMLKNQQFNGEKETYWLGLEIVQAPYYKFNRTGSLGYLNHKKDSICGHILHGDEYGNPLWWNGGLRQTKHVKESPWVNFRSYIWEVEDNSSFWKWPESCLKKTSQPIYHLNKQQLQLIQMYQKYNCSSFNC